MVYIRINLERLYRPGEEATVGPVLAGPIFVRKRGRDCDKLCTNAIMIVSNEHAQTSTYAYTR